ncbi:MAG TPA: hypothetical protein VFU43_13050 [Streptosporangiaceae bacterium]|nr:hypothetical protein [Streptosporangiaceae bacterium]
MVLLGVDDLFELTSVEENPTAIFTLVDVHAVAVKCHHAALALRASHTVSIVEVAAGDTESA